MVRYHACSVEFQQPVKGRKTFEIPQVFVFLFQDITAIEAEGAYLVFWTVWRHGSYILENVLHSQRFLRIEYLPKGNYGLAKRPMDGLERVQETK